MQETYGRAFRSWRSYTPGTNMRAWLLRILTNLNLDRGRKIQRTPDVQPLEEGDYYLANRMAEAQGEQVLDQERVVERLSQDSIVTALSSLPHDFRDVVVLVDIGEFSYADAAQILDIPIGTVMSRLHRAAGCSSNSSPRRRSRESRACDACEELLQGYLDRELSDAEVVQANHISTAATIAGAGIGSRCRSGRTSGRPRSSGCRPGCWRSSPSSAQPTPDRLIS